MEAKNTAGEMDDNYFSTLRHTGDNTAFIIELK